MATPRPGSDGGFTLIEVLVAVLIMAFIALAIVSLFIHSSYTNLSGFHYAVVSSEARRAMETLVSLDFNHTALDATSGSPRALTGALGTGYAPPSGYQVDYSVTEYDVDRYSVGTFPWTLALPGTGNVKRITMRVRAPRSAVAFGRRELVVTTLMTLR